MNIQFYEDGSSTSQISNSIKQASLSGKRKIPKVRWYLIVALVASPMLYFIFDALYSQIFVQARGYVSYPKIEMTAPHKGLITEHDLVPGSNISKGDLLFAIVDPELEYQRDRLVQQLAALKSENKTYSQKTISLLKQNQTIAAQQVKFKKEHLNKLKALQSQGAATSTELDAAKAQYAQAFYDLQNVNMDINNFEQQNQQAWTAYQKARERAIQTEIDKIDAKRYGMKIFAPVSGTVSEIRTNTGEYVTDGNNMLTIVPNKKPHIVAYLDPKNASFAKKGQRTTLKMPNGKVLYGTVTHTPQLAKRHPSDTINPLSKADNKVMVLIKPDTALPANAAIDSMPLTVKFHQDYNAKTLARIVGLGSYVA